MDKFETDEYGQPLHTGLHPTFHALWHLKALGVVDDLDAFASKAWAAAAKGAPVRVALIDTPVAYRHPNLTGAIDLGLMRDFSVHDAGVFVVAMDALEGKDRESRESVMQALRDKTATGAALSEQEATILAESAGTDDRPPCAPRFFGAHGTAMAGLIGGRPPAMVKGMVPSHYADKTEPATPDQDLALPYAGINPYCRIVPISTTASPDPGMVAAALDYALLIGAQIVVIAAAWQDTAVYRREKDRWATVDRLLGALQARAVVLCAAGNAGATDLAYPALLTKAGGLIAVTACDEKGDRLPYAPEQGSGAQVILALSSSDETYDREVIATNPWAKADPEVLQPDEAPTGPAKQINHIPAKALISLDVPGPFGYNPSPYRYTPPAEGPHFEIGSLYCRFSGTSAATAVAAGLISLVRQGRQAAQRQPDQGVPAGWTPAPGLFDLDEARAL